MLKIRVVQDYKKERVLALWNNLPEEEKQRFAALDKEWEKENRLWASARLAPKDDTKEKLHANNEALLRQIGGDWCEENGFERSDFDYMFLEE